MTKDKKIEKKVEEEITIDELWDVLSYAEKLESGFIRNAFSPYLVNDRMKDINLNPLEVTSQKITDALNAPKESETELRGYSENFELNSMVYKRMLNYLSNLLSFDLTYVCTNKDVNYKSSSYKRDEWRVIDFLDRFDVVEEFKKVMKQLLRQEVFFGILRDEDDRYILQELPNEYCKITGRFSHGLLYSFDMLWFVNTGVDIDMYPDIMKKMYNEAFAPGKKIYDPAYPLARRGGSTFAQWVDCSPNDKFWAWKFTPEITTRIPYLAGLFADLALQPIMREAQKNSDIISASKLLIGEIPYLKGTQAQKKDDLAMDVNTLANFMAILKRGVGDAIKVGAAPLEEIQGISFPTENPEMYSNYLSTLSRSSGISGGLLFATEKMTAIESKLSVDVDTFLVDYIYPSFEKFLEFYANKITKKHKFKFNFEGTEFSTNRDERLETQMKLAEKGIILPQKIAAAAGMRPQDMIRQMEMGEASGFMDKLTPIINASQASKEDRENIGRPTKSDKDLGESGDQTRADGGNENKDGEL